ncbi:hypothetical protein HPB47_000217 [Ixodes persulcatus]|uniref:Uncharacterized protein n=1 Tax=Ixodes persulcatus TaxID=34615 RepID=A0AC60PSC6_IXOPE|nr:hypothetical protein HPB47_000217 [Ixodes persulcatus]
MASLQLSYTAHSEILCVPLSYAMRSVPLTNASRLSANRIDRTDQQSEPRRKLGDEGEPPRRRHARAHGLGKGGALAARWGRMRLGGGTARQQGSTGECSGRAAVVQRGGAATAAAQRLRRRKQREDGWVGARVPAARPSSSSLPLLTRPSRRYARPLPPLSFFHSIFLLPSLTLTAFPRARGPKQREKDAGTERNVPKEDAALRGARTSRGMLDE